MNGVRYVIFIFVLMLLFSYGASRGYLHFDSGLYHAQAIRWIEEYGVVPGLANLHCSSIGHHCVGLAVGKQYPALALGETERFHLLLKLETIGFLACAP